MTELNEIKTYQELMLYCLDKYELMSKNLCLGDYTSKMNLYESMSAVWKQYLYWKDKLEETKNK